jgi:hypothetical protein
MVQRVRTINGVTEVSKPRRIGPGVIRLLRVLIGSPHNPMGFDLAGLFVVVIGVHE